MKILYDHQIFAIQRVGGISRYYVELAKHLAVNGDLPTISVKYSNNFYLNQIKGQNHKTFLPHTEFKGKRLLFSLLYRLNRRNSLKMISSGKFDVFHPTYYEPEFLESLGQKPFVLTVHDMIHEKFGKQMPHYRQTLANKKLLVSKADKIICVSECTKKRLG